MNSGKRGFVPLFSVLQTEQSVLASVIIVVALILVTAFPILLLLILIIAVAIGIVSLIAIIAGLVDMNKEALEYRAVD